MSENHPVYNIGTGRIMALQSMADRLDMHLKPHGGVWTVRSRNFIMKGYAEHEQKVLL